MIWDWSYAWHILPMILRGAVVTIEATLLGTALSALLGLVWAALQLTQSKFVGWAALGLTEFIRDTPLLIQIYFVFYVMPTFGLTLSPLTAGVLALGINYSAYVSEIYRAGLGSVPKGQWEAARALNLGHSRTFFAIILPQAIPPVLPALGNNLIAMFKDTPLLYTITVAEMMERAIAIGDATFRYLEPITIVGLLFLLMSLVSSAGVNLLAKRMANLAGGRTS